MPRANTLNRSLDDLTIGQLHRLLHAGLDQSLTVADALTALDESDQAVAAHAADVAEFERYRAHREERLAAALARAAAAADRGTADMASGRGWQLRQDARIEAAETFERREPELAFREWIDRGKPDVHEVEAGIVKRAVDAVVNAVIA